MLDVKTIKYEQSRNKFFQGNRDELQKLLNNGYYVVYGSNGSYRLARSAKAILIGNVNGQELFINVKDLICEVYNKQRISEKLVYKFLNDIRNKKIKLDYNGQNIIVI